MIKKDKSKGSFWIVLGLLGIAVFPWIGGLDFTSWIEESIGWQMFLSIFGLILVVIALSVWRRVAESVGKFLQTKVVAFIILFGMLGTLFYGGYEWLPDWIQEQTGLRDPRWSWLIALFGGRYIFRGVWKIAELTPLITGKSKEVGQAYDYLALFVAIVIGVSFLNKPTLDTGFVPKATKESCRVLFGDCSINLRGLNPLRWFVSEERIDRNGKIWDYGFTVRDSSPEFDWECFRGRFDYRIDPKEGVVIVGRNRAGPFRIPAGDHIPSFSQLTFQVPAGRTYRLYVDADTWADAKNCPPGL